MAWGSRMRNNSRDIVCLNCGLSIQLPSGMRRKTGLRPKKGTVSRLLLACSSCGHVYGYELPPYPLVLREGSDASGLVLRSVACRCTDSNCKFPVAVLVVLPVEIDAEAELARRRASWTFHGATCPFRHPLGSQQAMTDW
jgi:hypothetical protein